jgi:hypothetical protein
MYQDIVCGNKVFRQEIRSPVLPKLIPSQDVAGKLRKFA